MKKTIILLALLTSLISCDEKETLSSFALLSQSNGAQKISPISPTENSAFDLDIAIDNTQRFQQMDGFG